MSHNLSCTESKPRAVGIRFPAPGHSSTVIRVVTDFGRRPGVAGIKWHQPSLVPEAHVLAALARLRRGPAPVAPGHLFAYASHLESSNRGDAPHPPDDRIDDRMECAFLVPGGPQSLRITAALATTMTKVSQELFGGRQNPPPPDFWPAVYQKMVEEKRIASTISLRSMLDMVNDPRNWTPAEYGAIKPRLISFPALFTLALTEVTDRYEPHVIIHAIVWRGASIRLGYASADASVWLQWKRDYTIEDPARAYYGRRLPPVTDALKFQINNHIDRIAREAQILQKEMARRRLPRERTFADLVAARVRLGNGVLLTDVLRQWTGLGCDVSPVTEILRAHSVDRNKTDHGTESLEAKFLRLAGEIDRDGRYADASWPRRTEALARRLGLHEETSLKLWLGSICARGHLDPKASEKIAAVLKKWGLPRHMFPKYLLPFISHG